MKRPKPYRLKTEQDNGFTCIVGYYKSVDAAERAFFRYLKQEKEICGNMTIAESRIEKRLGNRRWKIIKVLRNPLKHRKHNKHMIA